VLAKYTYKDAPSLDSLRMEAPETRIVRSLECLPLCRTILADL